MDSSKKNNTPYGLHTGGLGIAITELHFSVELDAEDISNSAMPLNKSDELIREAIYEKYGSLVDKITVESWKEVEVKVREGKL